MSRRSKVEITGWPARHYDRLMDLLFVGGYHRFITNVIAKMGIQPGDYILDLGSGTGRNACLMTGLSGASGRVVGVDISQQMLQQARRRCQAHPEVSFLDSRIEKPLPFHEEFDKACLFFVLHGFEDEDKHRIIANARQALKTDGTLWILDYNQFELDKLWLPLRWIFKRFECELAAEFLNLDLEKMLAGGGFGDFVSYAFLNGYVRLLGARKQ